ncbi:hypothetical protein [Capybara microvirus Cap1_SP_45]|nr:hypothetical protein [Capybara microvirus Cap1_SP_45]
MSYTFKVENKTHYFGENTKLYNNIVNPRSYAALHSKQLSYYVRSYYEFLKTKYLNGKTMFLTFTYCDNALPILYGIPTVDNNNIRYLLRNSYLPKFVASKGYKMSYMIVPEFGEGKGSRGVGNNPHFHCLLHFYKETGEPFAYADGVDIYNKILNLWQGTNPDGTITRDPLKYHFGMVQASANGLYIDDYKACSYVSKYTSKDINTRTKISQIEKAIELDCFHYCTDSSICDIMNSLNVSDSLGSYLHKKYLSDDSPYRKDFEKRVKQMSAVIFADIKNRYLPKVFMSKGYGDYALNFVNEDFKLPIPQSNPNAKVQGTIFIDLPLYLYRKLFTDVHKDEKGNVIYVLNDTGKHYKNTRLLKDIDKTCNDVACLISDNFDMPLDQLSSLSYDYSLYKHIYEHHTFDIFQPHELDPLGDYTRFLVSGFETESFEEFYFVKKRKLLQSRLTYEFHPYFAPLIPYFRIIDNFVDNLNSENDKALYDNYLEIIRLRKVHNKML